MSYAEQLIKIELQMFEMCKPLSLLDKEEQNRRNIEYQNTRKEWINVFRKVQENREEFDKYMPDSRMLNDYIIYEQFVNIKLSEYGFADEVYMCPARKGLVYRLEEEID